MWNFLIHLQIVLTSAGVIMLTITSMQTANSACHESQYIDLLHERERAGTSSFRNDRICL